MEVFVCVCVGFAWLRSVLLKGHPIGPWFPLECCRGFSMGATGEEDEIRSESDC